MGLVREFRQLSQVIPLDYGADCAKLQRRREQGEQIHRLSAASQMIHAAAPANTGVRYVYSSDWRGAVGTHKSGRQEEFVALPSTRLQEGRARHKCALTHDLREQLLHGHALMIQRASLFM